MVLPKNYKYVQTPTATENDVDVPLTFAKSLLVQARKFGKDVDRIVEAAGFPFNPLNDDTPENTVITVTQYSRLCMELFESLQDESGGIIQGVPTPVGSSRMLAYSIIHCQNLQDALQRSIEFNSVCREQSGSVQRHDLVVADDHKLVTLNYLSQPLNTELGRQDGVLCSMAVWLRMCSWLIGKNIEVVAAGCASSAPENRSGLQHFFKCPIEFEQPCNWMRFSAAYLDARIVRSEEELEQFLKIAPYHVVIKPVENEQSVTARIKQIIGGDLQEELPTFEQLTQLLNMSARTLRRRLDKEGTSYQRIKDSARRDVAIELLSNPELTVSDVADLVGFSDPSAFHRSFKRWTGLSPGEYR